MSAETIQQEQLEKMLNGRLDEIINERLEAILPQKLEEAKRKEPVRMALIATKGTLDWAYPPLILASTAAAMDIETQIFFTFYGLNIIHKEKNKHLQVPPLGNPAMPGIGGIGMPNFLGALPGMTPMATTMMKSMFKKHNVATIDELLEMCVESDVKMVGCQMTMDVFGYKREDFMDNIEVGGAATFMEFASRSQITLLV